MFRSSRIFIKVVAVCILIALVLSGCAIATDYKLKALMLIAPPEKLVYVIGQDERLNLDDGKIRKFQDFAEGFYVEACLDAFGYDTYRGKYFHPDVDFTKEGTYLVNFAKTYWFSWFTYFQFTVQVITPGEYEVYTSENTDDFISEIVDPAPCENVTAVMLSPPSNIIYPVGYTGEIDPSGIVVKAAKGWFAKKYDINDFDYTLTPDVDFNTPGSYIVRVDYTDKKGKPYWFSFTVAVAEKAK